MALYSIIAIYLLVWVLVFFMVLPTGVRSLHETGRVADAGHDPGAPVAPQLRRKVLQTSLISLVVTAVICTVIIFGYVDRLLYWLIPV